jgi:conjugative transfer signal peptidase TraF
LQPDSGGVFQKMHNRVVRKLVTLCCLFLHRWPLAVVALSMGIVFVAAAFDLRVNTTRSMPLGLYREVPLRLERGAWVIFCLPEEPARLGRERAYLRGGACSNGSQELVKEIAAIPGDHITLSLAGMVVNGRTIPGTAIQAVDHRGRMLFHAALGHRCVHPGELWVLGIDPHVSWDSRYFGPVPIDQVRAAAIPILTFDLALRRGVAAGDRP